MSSNEPIERVTFLKEFISEEREYI